VWNGSIKYYDGATQLLLLVDYIFDWARDIYRVDIIERLRRLASGANDTASVIAPDSDIYSTIQIERPVSPTVNVEHEEFQDTASLRNSFLKKTSNVNAIRHATFVESKYCCILITRDNVETFCLNINQSSRPKLTELLLRAVQIGFVAEARNLRNIEETWTGHMDDATSSYSPRSRYFAALVLTTYLCPEWHIVRELYMIAIAQDAWDELGKVSKLNEADQMAIRPSSNNLVDEATILETVKKFKSGSPRHILYSSIQRRALKIQGQSSQNVSVAPFRNDDRFRDIVHFLYESFSNGDADPDKPFIKFSKTLEQQHLYQTQVEPLPLGKEFEDKTEDCVLLASDCHTKEQSKPRSLICVYIVENLPDASDYKLSGENIRKAFEIQDVYHTTLDNGASNMFNLRKRFFRNTHWNLKNTYGIYGDPSRFVRFLDELRVKAPVTQGSRRYAGESGQYLHKRVFSPWTDACTEADCEHGCIRRRAFIIYKIMTREILYWRNKAEVRALGGVSCCMCCAAFGAVDICYYCSEALEDKSKPAWLKSAMLGEQRIPYGSSSLSQSLAWHEISCSEGLRCDEIWTKFLGIDPQLDEHFESIEELCQQWRNFKRKRHRPLDFRPTTSKLQNKRKRPAE
jgi:hypothetical protein